MDGSTLMTAISTVGFPIVMCVIMVYYINQQNKDYLADREKMGELINNNTLALNKLIDRIGAKDGKE